MFPLLAFIPDTSWDRNAKCVLGGNQKSNAAYFVCINEIAASRRRIAEQEPRPACVVAVSPPQARRIKKNAEEGFGYSHQAIELLY